MARKLANKIHNELWGNMRHASEQRLRMQEDVDYQEFHDSETAEERSMLPPGSHITTAEEDSQWQ